MATLTEVVYPSIASFTGATQLNFGPYFVPAVNTLIKAEVHGKLNFQAEQFGVTSVETNYQLWALQWVAHGAAAQDCVTTADGVNWLIRQQVGDTETRVNWDASSGLGAVLIGNATTAKWAGQLAIGGDIDLYLSMRAPTGVGISNFNYFGSIRFWWA